jgi:hypothetical protein
MKQENIVIDNKLLKVFETGNVAFLDTIISPDFINYTPKRDLYGTV